MQNQQARNDEKKAKDKIPDQARNDRIETKERNDEEKVQKTFFSPPFA